MSDTMTAPSPDDLTHFGHPDDATLRQMRTCLSARPGARGVLCADSHKGYAHPIGGVIAYPDAISISGVGFDIACGNLACRTDAPAADIHARIETIMDDIVVRDILGARIVESVHNHHNFAWRETHDGRDWWVIKGVCLRGGGCDEAPQAYRRLSDVLKRHAGTVRILHTRARSVWRWPRGDTLLLYHHLRKRIEQVPLGM